MHVSPAGGGTRGVYYAMHEQLSPSPPDVPAGSMESAGARLLRGRSVGQLEHRCAAAGGAQHFGGRPPAEVVVHFADAGGALHQLFRHSFLLAGANAAAERAFAALDVHFDIARVDSRIVGQPIADALANP